MLFSFRIGSGAWLREGRRLGRLPGESGSLKLLTVALTEARPAGSSSSSSVGSVDGGFSKETRQHWAGRRGDPSSHSCSGTQRPSPAPRAPAEVRRGLGAGTSRETEPRALLGGRRAGQRRRESGKPGPLRRVLPLLQKSRQKPPAGWRGGSVGRSRATCQGKEHGRLHARSRPLTGQQSPGTCAVTRLV